MTGRSTDDDVQVLAHKLVVLVKWEGLYDAFQNERNSSVELIKLERELIWPGSTNGIKSCETRGILHALGLTEGNPTSPGAAEAQPKHQRRVTEVASASKAPRTTIPDCRTHLDQVDTKQTPDCALDKRK
jgi:hypothetical protein